MDQVILLLVVSLAVSCLVQPVTPVLTSNDGALDYDTSMPVQLFEDQFDMKDKTDIDDPSLPLSRFRRQTVHMLLASQHYNSQNNPERATNRWAHRRANTRNQGRGQVVEY